MGFVPLLAAAAGLFAAAEPQRAPPSVAYGSRVLPLARLAQLGAESSAPALLPREPEFFTAGRKIGVPENMVQLEPRSFGTLDALRPTREHLELLAKPRHYAWQRRSKASTFTNPMLADNFVMERGRAMVDLIAALPEERRALGLSGLPFQTMFGSMCEPPALDVEIMHDGDTWETRYLTEPFALATAPVPALYALSSTCTDALLNTGGAIAGAIDNGCSGEDEAAHFPDPSDCRTCLLVDGDHARCVASNACKPKMNREMGLVVGNQTEYYDVLESLVVGCAPNLMTSMFYLTAELGPENRPPPAFDHVAFHTFCFWTWNVGNNAPALFCQAQFNEIKVSVADVAVGRVEYIRQLGETELYHNDRWWFASTVDIDGYQFDSTPLPANSVAQISVPGSVPGSWGFPPDVLRPDGTDMNDPNHTYARDWIAALTLKTATRIDGVLINFFNRNLCPPDSWKGPDRLGRYYCVQPDFPDEPPPDDDKWRYDYLGYTRSGPPVTAEMYPWLTIASTGLMDPKIPGGHVSHILGSPVLADPDWENCAWPDRFEPDEMGNWDGLEYAITFTSQTYRFDKPNPEFDIRVALAATWRRAFCSPSPPAP